MHMNLLLAIYKNSLHESTGVNMDRNANQTKWMGYHATGNMLLFQLPLLFCFRMAMVETRS